MRNCGNNQTWQRWQMSREERVTQKQPLQTPPPQTGIPEIAGFHWDLCFCLDIAVRRLKDICIPGSLFPFSSLQNKLQFIPLLWAGLIFLGDYSISGIVLCFAHVLPYLLITTAIQTRWLTPKTSDKGSVVSILPTEERLGILGELEFRKGFLTPESKCLSVGAFYHPQVGKPDAELFPEWSKLDHCLKIDY